MSVLRKFFRRFGAGTEASVTTAATLHSVGVVIAVVGSFTDGTELNFEQVAKELRGEWQDRCRALERPKEVFARITRAQTERVVLQPRIRNPVFAAPTNVSIICEPIYV